MCTRSLRSRFAKLEPPGRLPGVDLARGGTVIGMLAAHHRRREGQAPALNTPEFAVSLKDKAP